MNADLELIYLDGALDVADTTGVTVAVSRWTSLVVNPWRPWDIVKRVWEWVKELLEDLSQWLHQERPAARAGRYRG